MAQSVEAFQHDSGIGDLAQSRDGMASVSVFANRSALRERFADQVLESGLVLRQAETLSRLTDGGTLVLGDVVVIDAPVVDGELLAAFARLDMRAARSGAQVIVSTGVDGLDGVFGCFDQASVQILVAPSDGDRAIALGNALVRVPNSAVHELSGEDRIALVRLTEQVQRLAHKMEGLAGQEAFPSDGGQSDGRSVHSPNLGYMAQQPSRSPLGGKDEPGLPSPVLVREIIRQRQLRARFFDPELFADPAWDMLLDLTAARGEGKQVSVSSLCIAACVPPTTALRWIGQMTESGLLDRLRDPEDRRRAFIDLSEVSSKAMAAYFQRLDNGAVII